MRIACLCLSLAAGLVVLSDSGAAGCLSYDGRVTLEGSLGTQTFPGPPNYESIAAGDRPETVLVLRLDAPVCVDAASDGMSDAVASVETIQLALRGPEQFASMRKLVGRRIRLTGSLFGAISAHHHTPVLLEEIAIVP
jgi:hypothetical protein